MKITLMMDQPNVTTLGPYKRYGVWVDGCHKSCPGCIYKLHRSTPYTMEVDDLIKRVDESDSEGVTISGGEPFLQKEGLLELVKKLRQKGYGIIVYTGFTIEELKNDETSKAILDEIDLLIDGEYIQMLDKGTSLKGSSNQIANFLTQRYKEYGDLYDDKANTPRNNDIRYDPKNKLLVQIGIPTRKITQFLIKLMKK